MVATKLVELRNHLWTFFVESGKEYLFPLSTRDCNQAGERERDRKFYCLCFNDGDISDGDNYLITFLVKRKNENGTSNATPKGEPGECKSKIGPVTIKNLLNHYLDYHPKKLYEFLRHAALKSSDQQLRSGASKVLLAWYEREREYAENAPQFKETELRIFDDLANIPSTSSNFGLILNQDDQEQSNQPETEITIGEYDVDETDLFRHNVSDELVIDEEDNVEPNSDRNNNEIGPSSGVRAMDQGSRFYPSTSGDFIVRELLGSQHKRVSSFGNSRPSDNPQASRVPKITRIPHESPSNVTPRNVARSQIVSTSLLSKNTNGIAQNSNSSSTLRTPTLARQSSNTNVFRLQHHSNSRPGPYIPQHKN